MNGKLLFFKFMKAIVGFLLLPELLTDIDHNHSQAMRNEIRTDALYCIHALKILHVF